ncbi:MAG: PIG-L family deacetylase [Gammaproteobacteria bacterium]|nr:PIG-L family deacetylase [Gammaproteobacteria bacterium]
MEFKDMINAYSGIKELSEFKNPLFIGPHPDDIEFGCGGLISKLKDKGAHISFLIVTDGAAGTKDPNADPKIMMEIREKEAILSAKFLGVSQIDFLRYEDGGEYTVQALTNDIARHILKVNPDIVFTVDPKLESETHSDHLKVGEASREALQVVPYPVTCKRHGIDISNVKTFPNNIMLAYYFTDKPNMYTEISEENFNDKVKSLLLHQSQMSDPQSGLLLEYFKFKAELDGKDIGKPLAESYQIVPSIMSHVYSLGLKF